MDVVLFSRNRILENGLLGMVFENPMATCNGNVHYLSLCFLCYRDLYFV
jgi:hypothetical protein